MTDREIIKSLYCCDNAFCEDCCYKQFTITCTSRIAHDALELVIRQQAEIEDLRRSYILAVEQLYDETEKMR